MQKDMRLCPGTKEIRALPSPFLYINAAASETCRALAAV